MTRLELTPEERAVMCHAIGLKSPHTGCETQNIGWRNRYVCDPSEVWSGLVDRGLARQHRSSLLPASEVWYSVTELGWSKLIPGVPYQDFESSGIKISGDQASDALGEPRRKRLTRSQMRYQRYRKFGDGFDSFIEFCRWDSEKGRPWNA
jgi:hypothetical protein